MRKVFAIAAIGTLAAGGAHAQDVYVDETGRPDAPYVDHRDVVGEEVIEEAAPVAPDISGPRVYGWNYVEIRPEDCGTFKYWNGEYCADARYEPPPAD
jgi:hypothetical protein